MSAKPTFSTQLVHHVAGLANLPLSPQEETALAQSFSETLDVITNLSNLDTSQVEPTAQTSGLENVWRDDSVDAENSFSQAEALANAPATADGFFVVKRILHHDK